MCHAEVKFLVLLLAYIYLVAFRSVTNISGKTRKQIQQNFIISNLKGPGLTARYIRGSK